MIEKSEKVGVMIGTIGDAEKYIVEDARRKVLALDWSFTSDRIGKEEIDQLFDLSYPLVLRQSDLNLPLNLLNTKKPEEATILNSLGQYQKKQLFESYWFVLLKPTIWPEEATFIRDWLYLKAIDVVTGRLELSEEELKRQFSNNEELKRTSGRVALYLARHYPHVLREAMGPSN